jgi:hypothetical protein
MAETDEEQKLASGKIKNLQFVEASHDQGWNSRKCLNTAKLTLKTGFIPSHPSSDSVTY